VHNHFKAAQTNWTAFHQSYPVLHLLQIVFPSCAPAFQTVQRSASSVPFVDALLIQLTISLGQGPSEKNSISASQEIH
jgi:hypothetical protein